MPDTEVSIDLPSPSTMEPTTNITQPVLSYQPPPLSNPQNYQAAAHVPLLDTPSALTISDTVKQNKRNIKPIERYADTNCPKKKGK